jgi:hypothetical protein
MREPTRDEMQIAIFLMEEMTLTADSRSLLKRITAGEVVQKEALILLRSLGDTYMQQRLASRDNPA